MKRLTRELEDKRNENRPVSVRYRGYMVNTRRRNNVRGRRVQERRTPPPRPERLGSKVLSRQERVQIRPERKDTPFRLKYRRNPKKSNVLIGPAEAPTETTPPTESSTPTVTTAAPETLNMDQLTLQQRMEN